MNLTVIFFSSLPVIIWTIVLIRRVAYERGMPIVWARLVALDFLVWLVALSYLLEPFFYPDLSLVRFTAGVVWMALVIVGLALLLLRQRNMR